MIILESIDVSFDEQPILQDVHLKIADKERLVLLGSSGSGKTTVLKLIAGFVTPDRGKVFIDGQLASEEGKILMPPHQRDVSMVFQDLALWPHMNVAKNIAFGLKIQGMPKREREKKVHDILSMVGLEDAGKKRIEQLSGGEKQRVALARSLVLSPKVLLMDEPLSSLDPALNVRLRTQIVKLQEELGFTLVYVTHNEAEAKEIATRVVFMQKGKIVE